MLQPEQHCFISLLLYLWEEKYVSFQKGSLWEKQCVLNQKSIPWMLLSSLALSNVSSQKVKTNHISKHNSMVNYNIYEPNIGITVYFILICMYSTLYHQYMLTTMDYLHLEWPSGVIQVMIIVWCLLKMFSLRLKRGFFESLSDTWLVLHSVQVGFSILCDNWTVY